MRVDDYIGSKIFEDWMLWIRRLTGDVQDKNMRVLRSTLKIPIWQYAMWRSVAEHLYKNTDLVIYQHKREERTTMQPKQQPGCLREWGAVVESTQIVTNSRNATDSTESFHESNQRATWSISFF